jgi:ParB-like chromosome segregation protein Spo0J
MVTIPSRRDFQVGALPPIGPELRDRLREDIRQRGILVPVLLADDGQCIDGNLRLAIAEELGLSSAEIPKIVIGRLTQDERTDIRVALNLCRRQLSQAQVREIIAWELRRHPHTSDRGLGRKIGVDNKTVGGVRRQLEAGEEIPHVAARSGRDGKTYRNPIVFTNSNAQAVEAQRLLQDLGDDVPDGPLSVKKLRRMKNAKERADALEKISRIPPKLGKEFQIHKCDFRQIGERIATGSVDLALCDPPWGSDFAPLRVPFGETIFRLLKPDGLLACYTGVAHLPEFLDAFRSAGLVYQWTIVGRRQVSTVQQRNMLINRWIPIVIFSKSSFRPASPFNDIMDFTARDKALHPWQQPVDEAVALIRALTRPGALVCDLVVGSGTTAVATVEAEGGRRFVGCECDELLVKAARFRVAEALRRREQAGRTSPVPA